MLISMILVPMFLAILQLGLDLYVRNTLTACAQGAARFAANADIGGRGGGAIQAASHDDAQRCIRGSLSAAYAGHIAGTARSVSIDGSEPIAVVDVEVSAPLPIIGFLGIGHGRLTVSGHALQETP